MPEAMSDSSAVSTASEPGTPDWQLVNIAKIQLHLQDLAPLLDGFLLKIILLIAV